MTGNKKHTLTKQFIIKKVCNEEDRPPYSNKVDEYFEDLVEENILGPLNIIGSTDWRELLSIMYFKKEDNSPEGINFYEASVIEEEKIKFYPVAISLDDVYTNNATPLENIIGLYYQVISLFFLTYYKSVSREFLLKLKDKLDWDYLLSLPYPAPFNEQKYVGD